jgi:SsrA-binding protein
MNHDPLRVRKLLLHKQEIRKLYSRTQERGQSVIPLKAYFKNGKVKILLGVGRGKKTHDRRQDLKKRTDKREMERAIRGRNR